MRNAGATMLLNKEAAADELRATQETLGAKGMSEKWSSCHRADNGERNHPPTQTVEMVHMFIQMITPNYVRLGILLG